MSDKKKKPRYRDVHGTTRVGDMLRKLADVGAKVAPELITIAGKATGVPALENLASLIRGDQDLTPENKDLLLRELELDVEAFKAEVSDRRSARSLYVKDSAAQKILAAVFTAGYITLTYVLIDHFFNGTSRLEEYELTLISTLFAAMSTKVNTLIDFYFGGSMKRNNDDE